MQPRPVHARCRAERRRLQNAIRKDAHRHRSERADPMIVRPEVPESLEVREDRTSVIAPRRDAVVGQLRPEPLIAERCTNLGKNGTTLRHSDSSATTELEVLTQTR